MDTSRTDATGAPGDPGRTAGPSPGLSPAGPRTNGPPVGTTQRRNAPPVEFPIEMKINITPAMNAALALYCRRRKFKPAVIARVALMEFLERYVPQYREE